MIGAGVLRRAVHREPGAVGPIGVGNAKTASIGTYRAVGATCPETCPYLAAGCYARGGRVAIAQSRAGRMADDDPESEFRAIRIALTFAARTGAPCRLQVSGDLGRTADDVEAYTARVVAIIAAIRSEYLDAPAILAWTYTHHPRSDARVAAAVYALRVAGVAVRWSDDAGPWGAIVADHDEGAAALSHRVGRPVILCPAQRSHRVTCATCRLCWTRPESVIAFDPHGEGAKAARRASPHTIGGA